MSFWELPTQAKTRKTRLIIQKIVFHHFTFLRIFLGKHFPANLRMTDFTNECKNGHKNLIPYNTIHKGNIAYPYEIAKWHILYAKTIQQYAICNLNIICSEYCSEYAFVQGCRYFKAITYRHFKITLFIILSKFGKIIFSHRKVVAALTTSGHWSIHPRCNVLIFLIVARHNASQSQEERLAS